MIAGLGQARPSQNQGRHVEEPPSDSSSSGRGWHPAGAGAASLPDSLPSSRQESSDSSRGVGAEDEEDSQNLPLGK